MATPLRFPFTDSRLSDSIYEVQSNWGWLVQGGALQAVARDMFLGPQTGGYPTITGSAASAFPALVGAAAASACLTSTAAGVLPATVGAAAATETASAVVSADLPVMVGDIEITETLATSIVAGLAALVGAADATEAAAGTVAGVLPAPVLEALAGFDEVCGQTEQVYGEIMALLAGNVVTDSGGTPTGTGLAREMYDAMLTRLPTIHKGARRGVADLCSTIASAVVSHVMTNAALHIEIGSSTGGLQRLPTPATAGSATVGPAAPVTLVGTIV